MAGTETLLSVDPEVAERDEARQDSVLEYALYRSYGTLRSCEREESGTRTVGRCGTHGGPPGRMILAQYVPRSTFRFLTELNALPPHGTNSRSFGTAALHGTTPPLDSPGLA